MRTESEIASSAFSYGQDPVQVGGDIWPLVAEDAGQLLVQPYPEVTNIFEDRAYVDFRGQAVSRRYKNRVFSHGEFSKPD